MKILHFPLTRIFFGFLFGILFFQAVDLRVFLIFIGLGICLIGLIVSLFFSSKNNFWKTLFGSLVLIISFLIGIATGLIHKENFNPNHYTNQISDYEKVHNLDLLLIDKLKNTQKNYRYTSSIKMLDGQ